VNSQSEGDTYFLLYFEISIAPEQILHLEAEVLKSACRVKWFKCLRQFIIAWCFCALFRDNRTIDYYAWMLNFYQTSNLRSENVFNVIEKDTFLIKVF
jgi:hypothetical protein